jgi:hypothetical protein
MLGSGTGVEVGVLVVVGGGVSVGGGDVGVGESVAGVQALVSTANTTKATIALEAIAARFQTSEVFMEHSLDLCSIFETISCNFK